MQDRKGGNSGYAVSSFGVRTMRSRLRVVPERRELMNIRKPTDYSLQCRVFRAESTHGIEASANGIIL